MNKYHIRVIVKHFNEDTHNLKIGEYNIGVRANSKREVQSMLKYLYEHIGIDPETVESVEIEENEQ